MLNWERLARVSAQVLLAGFVWLSGSAALQAQTGATITFPTTTFGPVYADVRIPGGNDVFTIKLTVPTATVGSGVLSLIYAGDLNTPAEVVDIYIDTTNGRELLGRIGEDALDCIDKTAQITIPEGLISTRSESDQIELIFSAPKLEILSNPPNPNGFHNNRLDTVCGGTAVPGQTGTIPFKDSSPFAERNGGDGEAFAVQGELQIIPPGATEDTSSNEPISPAEAMRQQVTTAATRGALISDHAPDVHGRIERLKQQDGEQEDASDGQAAAQLDALNFVGRGGGPNFVGLNSVGEGPAEALAGSKSNDQTPVGIALKDGRMNFATGAHRLGPMTVWSEGAIVGIEDTGDERQRFAIAHSGAEMQFGSRTIVGLGIQIDHLRYNDAPTGDELDGTGWMIGPYIHSRVLDNLFVDLRVAFGTVNTDVARANGTSDEYQSDRTLAQLKVIGDFTYAGILFAPKVEFGFYREGSEAYTSATYGAVPETTVELINGAVGGRMSRDFAFDGRKFSPYLEVAAVYYNFITGDDDILTLSYPDAIESWSGRVGAGLKATITDGTTLQFGAEYYGNGSDAWSLGGNANLTVRF